VNQITQLIRLFAEASISRIRSRVSRDQQLPVRMSAIAGRRWGHDEDGRQVSGGGEDGAGGGG
jgi:hypothetical protein